MAAEHPTRPHLDPAHAQVLCRSFKALLGRDLVDGCSLASPEECANALYNAPQIILSHDTSDDPCLTYANRAAQILWDMSWDDLIGLPSRKTAEPQHRDQRAAMFETMRKRGVVENYEGIRVSGTGKRFMIRNATIWTLTDDRGQKCGEAATFTDVTPLS